MQPTFCIVSPYQGTPLNSVALLSFTRTAKILTDVDWIFALPFGSDLSELHSVCGNHITVKYFPKYFFSSKRSAQHLYMHPLFYEAFACYDYILIHQPDVYVFHNSLQYWIDFMSVNKFDYIGAPWWNYEWLALARNPLARLPWQVIMNNKVGSGGFSIRRTRKFLAISQRYSILAQIVSNFIPEDIWWCQLVDLLGCRIHRPTADDAARFCFETQCSRNFEITGETLPFAAHGWNRHDWKFWRDKIPGALEIHTQLAAMGIREL
jgi:hypothetical protein